MSHLFISYSHKDRDILSTVLAYLKEQDFTENQIWYDNIEGDDNWRDEISSALDEAFVVVVIVTKNTVDSHYCTYEWAYALGQGIPILPLLFDEIPAKDIHAPLASKQFIDCTSEIPTTLKDKIKEHESTPPQVKVINQMVYEAIELTHKRYFILTKIGQYRFDDEYLYDNTRRIFYEEAHNALVEINQLMLDKRFAFSGRQYRYCWRIIQFLETFSEMRYEQRDHHSRTEDDYFMNNLASKFETEWLPAYRYFAGGEIRWWERTSYKYFSFNLSYESSRLSIFKQIVIAFPDIDIHDVTGIIENLQRSQERENNSDSE